MDNTPIQSHYEQVYSSNEITLRSYESGIQEYLNEADVSVSEIWIDDTLSLLPPNARMIEIGSAFGRDAQYIESFGHSIERTDATASFVNFLQEQGYVARLFNILTDPFNAPYDLVFANSVFLHFTPQELEKVFEKIHATLNHNGVLAFSVKKGEGEEWLALGLGKPRYYCYWTADKLVEKLESAGFKVHSISEKQKLLVIAIKSP